MLDGLSDTERLRALARFRFLRPFLEDGVPLADLALKESIDVRTAQRWVKRYHRDGLAGLARRPRNDKNKRWVSTRLQHAIEGLALKQPPLSVAAIHRQAVVIAKELKEQPPGYSAVYSIVRQLEPALRALAHEGSKSYSEAFDLVHRTEAEAPNAIWQVDHTQLDILLDDRGTLRKPWLTIILDDYSRAVAGYALYFSAPSAIQTALALRHAIWRKPQPGWHVCGIPQVLYTDHGSDFTSQHIEMVAADLKIRLIFSTVGRPRGRGKIERFFKSISQILLSRLPGYAPPGSKKKAAGVLTLEDLARELEAYLVDEYHAKPHSTTGEAPQMRWDKGGFLPQMSESLVQLDLLLLTVPKTRRVRQDGIHFMGMRYIDPTLAAYIGEEVLLRYDPRDVAEIRIFHENRFLCRAICQELAGETVPLRDIVNARNRRRRELRQQIEDRRRTADALMEVRRWTPNDDEAKEEPQASARARKGFSKSRRAARLMLYRDE